MGGFCLKETCSAGRDASCRFEGSSYFPNQRLSIHDQGLKKEKGGI